MQYTSSILPFTSLTMILYHKPRLFLTKQFTVYSYTQKLNIYQKKKMIMHKTLFYLL